MQRSLRSNLSLPDNFEFPNFSRGRIQLNIMADAVAAAGAPVVAPTEAVLWQETPDHGNYNPGSKHGQSIFKSKTQGPSNDVKYNLTNKDASDLRRFLESKQNALGSVVTRVEVSFDPLNGNPTGFANILRDYSSISLERVQRSALKRFGTAVAEADPIPARPFASRTLDPGNDVDDKKTFYNRVHAHALAKLLDNTLTEASMATLALRKDEYTFYDDASGHESRDGTVMLLLAMQKADPSTIVGVELLRNKIELASLHQYKNNVDELSDDIEATYQKIINLGSTFESIRRHSLRALLSGSNDEFNGYIQRIKDDIESGSGPYKDMDWRDIITAGRTKYTNMFVSGDWTKVNPRDAKIMALTTELEAIKASTHAHAHATANDNSTNAHKAKQNAGGGDKVGGVDKWRTVKNGDQISRDGKTWYWCTQHVHPHGHFNGLYVLHKPAEHVDWKSRKTERKKNEPDSSSGKKAADSKASGDDKLTIAGRLKEVLCSRLMLSDDDADKLCSEITGQVN